MPLDKDIRIMIEDRELDLGEVKNLNLALNYSLEAQDNFQSKTSSTAYNVVVPATVPNDQIANGYHNPQNDDNTINQIFRGNRRAAIIVNGEELLTGKAFLFNAEHAVNPESYEYNFYGNNGDWIVDLKEKTIYDFFKDLTFTFSKANIVSSWGFDGTDENLPYVFAPVRYGDPMDTLSAPDPGVTGTVIGAVVTVNGSGYTSAPTVVFTGGGGTGAAGTAVLSITGRVVAIIITNPGSGYTSVPLISFTGGGGGSGAEAYSVLDVPVTQREDYNMKPEYMRPALSKYWLMYRAFKSLGYRIQSTFFDTDYFRRQVMPWTWGAFLISDGTQLDALDFLAKSASAQFVDFSHTGFWDLLVTNDSFNGGFDNNGVYSYVSTYNMRWEYLPIYSFGTLEASLHFNLFVDAVATANSDVEVRIQYFKNGVRVYSHDDNGNGTQLVKLNAPAIGRREFHGPVEDWLNIIVDPGDVIEARVYIHTFKSGSGIAHLHGTVDAWELDYLRIPLGGTVNFENYTALKKYKILDFLGGIFDEFNICVQTDAINKVVYMEPMHPYSLVDSQAFKTGGYFNGTYLNWEDKQDLSKQSRMEQFNDYERELLFKYKDDSNDGGAKTIQDRNVNTLALGKYVFPDRFKAGNKEIENRFFSVVVHYDVTQWKGLGSDPALMPQMIIMAPENVSNTSRNEAQNTFEPKSAYYKGLISTVGWVFDAEIQTEFPFMFAVNYMADVSGLNDPVLSYCDEQIGPTDAPTTVKGLVRRFYLQRLEIMRNGQFYNTWFKLNNKDILNFLHREHIICRGQRWELVRINNYNPLSDDSTEVFLRKQSPIKEVA